MTKSKLLVILAVLVLLASTPGLFGQSDPKIAYGELESLWHSRDLPAGTVMDPGSHLTYLLDTGVNARELLGDVSLATAESTPLVDLAAWLDKDGNGQLDADGILQNYVAITNLHPTMAVTVHFRYFNDNCDDVLDFLVILTCNDTLLFDPFNFVIPGTTENTRDRLIGPKRPGKVLSPIPTATYGSGRFIMTAAASGASVDGSADTANQYPDNGTYPGLEYAEILFPKETGADLDEVCNIEYQKDLTVADFASHGLNETLAGTVGNVGSNSGLVATNLHVFNAFQISFNFLTGVQTWADPNNFGQVGSIPAWARPAIDRDDWEAVTGIGQNYESWDLEQPEPKLSIDQFLWAGDGDGYTALTGVLVLGGEDAWTSVQTYQRVNDITKALIVGQDIYLRNEVHGGDIRSMYDAGGVVLYGGTSLNGAQATPVFFPVSADEIVQHFISVTDDYNGSNNAGVVPLVDHSSNISPAATTYVMQIYDNDEHLLVIEGEPPLNVSPPVPGEVVELKLVCICLRTFLTTTIAPGTNVDSLTLQEMNDILTPANNEILEGDGVDFAGLLKTLGADLSGGFIRYVRDDTNLVDMSEPTCDDVGFPICTQAVGTGSSTFLAPTYGDSGELGSSFLTISNTWHKVTGYGALWWNVASPYSALVSELGDPAQDRAVEP